MSIFNDLQNEIIPPSHLQTLGVPSASLALLENGQITTHVLTTGKENDQTVYQACSISKAITALGVARLVDEGRVSYDMKVLEYLPASIVRVFEDEGTRDLLGDVTVGMLLSHTAGLSQGGFPGYIGPLPTAEEVVGGLPPANTPGLRFLNWPGVRHRYSGGGFLLLQVVLERVTDTPFAELMRRIVLEPLGMERSWFGALPEGEGDYAKACYTGFVSGPGGAEFHSFVELAAAGLWSTPGDLLRAVKVVQESLSTDGGFLKRETARKMLTKVKDTTLDEGIGLGWFVDGESFAHTGGNDPGYNTYVLGFGSAEKGDIPRRGIAIMTNSSLGHEVCIPQIVSAVFYLKGWKRAPTLASYGGRGGFVPYAAPAGTQPAEEWRDWIGEWDSEWQLLDQDGPVWKYGSMQPFKVLPAADAVRPKQEERREVSLVVDKLKIGLTLGWEGDTRVIRSLQDEERVLKRTKG